MNALTGLRCPRATAGRHPFPISACIRGAYLNPEQDCIWDFDLVGHEVEARLYPGRVKGCQRLAGIRGVQSERAGVRTSGRSAWAGTCFLQTTAKANNALSTEQITQMQNIDNQLRASLGELDPFWIRWSQFRERLEARS